MPKGNFGGFAFDEEVFAGMMQEISALLQECKEQEKAALKVCEEPDGPYFYAVALEKWQQFRFTSR